MKDFRYLANVSSLTLDREVCVGCGMCAQVCPHRVLAIRDKKAGIVDFDGCIECGACATNCPVAAISVEPGVGCAAYIIQVWLKGRENASCGDGGSGGCC